MSINCKFPTLGSRLAFLLAVWLACAGFTALAVLRFAVTVLADARMPADQALLEGAAARFPDSAAVHARLAARLVEGQFDILEGFDKTAARAVKHATRATQLAPHNFEYRMLEASAHSFTGALPAAEAALRAALELAPANLRVHWQLGNVLLQTGKLNEALASFRRVVAADAGQAPTIWQLLWQASEQDVATLTSVAGTSWPARLSLVRFLSKQQRLADAAAIFRQLGTADLLEAPDAAAWLRELLEAGRYELAGSVWRALFAKQDTNGLLTNGGFETPLRKNWTHFDWSFGQSQQARIGLASGAGAHGGQRALRIAYLGAETTRLESAAQQLIPLPANARYQVECFVKADKFEVKANEGPRLVVLHPRTKAVLAASSNVVAGTYDWQPLALEFTAPADAAAVWLTVQQTPRFSFVPPPQGTVWFDDFSLRAR